MMAGLNPNKLPPQISANPNRFVFTRNWLNEAHRKQIRLSPCPTVLRVDNNSCCASYTSACLWCRQGACGTPLPRPRLRAWDTRCVASRIPSHSCLGGVRQGGLNFEGLSSRACEDDGCSYLSRVGRPCFALPFADLVGSLQALVKLAESKGHIPRFCLPTTRIRTHGISAERLPSRGTRSVRTRSPARLC